MAGINSATTGMGNGRVAGAAAGAAAEPFPVFGGGEDVRAPGAGAYVSASLQRYGGTDLGPAGRLFFDAANVDALQEAIRYRVFVESGGRFTIGRQSDLELGIIMRSIYLQDTSGRDATAARAGTAAGIDAVEHVRRLNRAVLEFCVPRVLEEVRMNKQYIADVSSLPVPMARGELATSKGSRVLEQRGF